MKILINFFNIIGPSANHTNGLSESQAIDEKNAVADESKAAQSDMKSTTPPSDNILYL